MCYNRSFWFFLSLSASVSPHVAPFLPICKQTDSHDLSRKVVLKKKGGFAVCISMFPQKVSLLWQNKSKVFRLSFLSRWHYPPSLDFCVLDVWLWHITTSPAQPTPQFLPQWGQLADCDGNTANVCMWGGHQPSQARSVPPFCKAEEIARLHSEADDQFGGTTLDKYKYRYFKIA